jgi:heterodisulfide reductase subunit A-like polyferredoxin
MDIPESVAQASSAAARAAQVISGPMPARLAS